MLHVADWFASFSYCLKWTQYFKNFVNCKNISIKWCTKRNLYAIPQTKSLKYEPFEKCRIHWQQKNSAPENMYYWRKHLFNKILNDTVGKRILSRKTPFSIYAICNLTHTPVRGQSIINRMETNINCQIKLRIIGLKRMLNYTGICCSTLT